MDEREKLLGEISALEEQVQNFVNDIQKMDTSGQVDAGAYAALIADRDMAQAKLSDKREELAQIEGAAETAHSDVSESLESLQIPGTDDTISLALLIMADEITLEDKMSTILGAFGKKLADAAMVRVSIENENQSLKSRVVEAEKSNDQLQGLNDSKDLHIADLGAKLSNAATQIEEGQAEIKRLAAEMDKLREQVSKSTLPTNENINVLSSQSVADAKSKLIPIVNLRWENDIKHVYRLAEHATTGETIRFHYFTTGLYRELTADEAKSFRPEVPTIPEVDVNEDNSLVIPPAIPSEGENAEVPGDSTSGSVVQEEVTRKEFNELVARVSQIEQYSVRVA